MSKNNDLYQELSEEEYQRLLRPEITEEDYISQTGRELQRNIQRATTDRTYDEEEQTH